ncbi:MAG: NmrA family transcriptional regulator [Planctomycetota bacterium]
MSTPTTLVIGSTGKTGSRIVQRLEAIGPAVRRGSRSAALPFDWADRTTWAPALAGVEHVYVAYSPDLAAPGGVDAIRELTSMALAANVRRVVLLSGRGEPASQACERIVLESGIPQPTVVRASWFAQNFSEGAFLPLVQNGAITLPADPQAREPFVDIDDLADVAVAALTQEGHAGRIYEVTGPRLLSWTEVAAELAAASGREVHFAQIPADDFRAALAAVAGPDEAALITMLVTELMDGRNAHLATGVRDALGREPRDFRDFARDAAARGVWSHAGARP